MASTGGRTHIKNYAIVLGEKAAKGQGRALPYLAQGIFVIFVAYLCYFVNISNIFYKMLFCNIFMLFL